MDNFLGLPKRESEYRRARYAVLPVPYDGTVSFQTGTRGGPRGIITASQQVELFDQEYGREFHSVGVATLDPLEPEAVPEDMVRVTCEAARRVVRDGKFLITLGGEHSISSGAIRAVQQRHKKLSVLQFDAHADLRNQYHGTPYSHACAMRRVWDLGVPVVGVGIRNYSLEEHRFMKKQGLTPISPRMIRETPNWMEGVLAGLSEEVYVSIDIDGFDPAYAPGTGTPEPGGLDWYQVTDLLKMVAATRQIVAADVVEVSPIPGTMQTEFLAAKLIYKMMAHIEIHR